MQQEEDINPELSSEERNAIRSFLQRSEVRISTMHRIATTFIGGAGLLLLVPIFLKDAIDNIILVLVRHSTTQFSLYGPRIDTIIILITIGYPLFLSLAVPLYALLILFKDIIQFYFSIYTPGYPGDLLNPSFSLSALTLSPDEAPKARKASLISQYRDPVNGMFMLPFSQERRKDYFTNLHAKTGDAILPPTRRESVLKEQGVLPENYDAEQLQYMNIAMGVARVNDRSLVEEVATTEMLMVRNILYLRRLIIRYTKALLMFIWTALVSFIVLPLIQGNHLPPLIVLGVGYLIWSICVLPLMSLPVHWMYRHRGEDKTHPVDTPLVHLENRVRYFIYFSIISSIIALVLRLA
jgi:hypothetical protein